MASILIHKNAVESFIDTCIVEAGSYLHYERTPGIPPHLDSVRPGVELESVGNHYSVSRLFHKVIGTLFRRHQVHQARETFEKSQNYVVAACLLKHSYHCNLQAQLKDVSVALIAHDIFNLACKIRDIDEWRKTEATNYSYCGILGCLGAGLLVTGVYISKPWFQTVGKMIGAMSGTLYVYTWLSHRGDRQKIGTSYEEIGKSGEVARAKLRYYEENMHLENKVSGIYQPIYKEFEYKEKLDFPLPGNFPNISYTLVDKPAE